MARDRRVTAAIEKAETVVIHTSCIKRDTARTQNAALRASKRDARSHSTFLVSLPYVQESENVPGHTRRRIPGGGIRQLIADRTIQRVIDPEIP
jgi:hypothetical protein